MIGAPGLTQPIQQALDAVPSQSETEVLATLSAQIQEPLANGGWEIGGLSLAHAVASIYGRMTFVTRQILA